MARIAQQTIDEIKAIPVVEIASATGNSITKQGKTFFGVCPNCGAKNFAIDSSRNIFKCFGDKHVGSCNASGAGALTYYSYHKFHSKDGHFLDCIEDVATLMGIPLLYDDGTVAKAKGERKKYVPVSIKKEEPPQEDKIVDAVYKVFLSQCPIRNQHATELLQTRGYSAEEVKMLGFRSVPTEVEAMRILSILKSKNYPLERIPGFTQKFIPNIYYHHLENYPRNLISPEEEQKGKKGVWVWTIQGAGNGYFIPVRDRYGRIIRLRVRVDKGKSKYIWFSSSERLDEESPLHIRKGGASCGAPINIVPPMQLFPHWKSDLSDILNLETVVITEGEHKSIISAKMLNMPFIGVPGVGNFKAVIPLLKEWGVKRVIIAYDTDSLKKEGTVEGKNENVFNFLKMFAVEVYQLDIETLMWTWDPKDGKGLDDLLLTGKKTRRLISPTEINFCTGERKMAQIKISV